MMDIANFYKKKEKKKEGKSWKKKLMSGKGRGGEKGKRSNGLEWENLICFIK